MDFEKLFPPHTKEKWIEQIEKEANKAYHELTQHYPDFSIEPAHAELSPHAEEVRSFFQTLSSSIPHLVAYFPLPENDPEKTLAPLLQLAEGWGITSRLLDLRFSEQLEQKENLSNSFTTIDWSLDPYIQSHLTTSSLSLSSNGQSLWILGDTWHEFHLTPAQQIKLILHTYEHTSHTTDTPISILLATSPQFLIEIAKIRALKFLFHTQYGHIPPIFVRTDFNSLTRLDIHDNLIRLTLQTYAGLMGGANAVLILPYTFWSAPWDLDAYRISWNIYFLFLYESHILEQTHAFTSSYVLESLTLRLIEKVNQISLPDSPISWIQALKNRMQQESPTIIGVTKYRDFDQSLDPPTLQWKRINPQPIIRTLYYEDAPTSN